jgi:hypothetical protein
VINLLDPDVIVLGGGCRTRPVYERVPGLWLPHVFSDQVADAAGESRAR